MPAWSDVRFDAPLRVHQRHAVEAVRVSIQAGHQRNWVVLPPGAGKTLVGLLTAVELGVLRRTWS